MGHPTAAVSATNTNLATTERSDNPNKTIEPSSEEQSSHSGSEEKVVPPTPATTAAQDRSIWNKIYSIIYWTPPKCRWDPDDPPRFTLALNTLFAFAGAFTVANLYYNHPILNILAADFGVPYVEVAIIPTLAQAGYATGLLFLCPLGDVLPRRPFILSMVFFTATACIGLCVTKSLSVFSAFQYISAVTTVTPQLMMPLVGDLAPPRRRASAMSIVASGLMLGILLARLLSGIIANYTSWRVVYWLSVAAQYTIFLLLWLFMPDYPSTNPEGMNYFKMLWSIVLMVGRHPVLVQACGIAFFASATFTNFWTTLTFLLAGPPYYYTPVIIGLLALVGIASMLCGPVYARYVTDRFVPWFSVFLGMVWSIIGIAVGTYTGTFSVAGPIVQAFFGDFGMITAQIANRSAIFAVEPTGRNRVNTAFMVFTFAGQLVGTFVGSQLYDRGGWIASGSFSMGSIGMALLITMARGPWEEGWVGWHGGYSIQKQSKESADGRIIEARSHLAKREHTALAAEIEVEKALPPVDQHDHTHGHDDMAEVNAMNSDKSLELAAAKDYYYRGDSEKTSTNSEGRDAANR